MAILKFGNTVLKAVCPGTVVDAMVFENCCSVFSRGVQVPFTGADATAFTDGSTPASSSGDICRFDACERMKLLLVNTWVALELSNSDGI